MPPVSREDVQQEMIGAFVHEMRTPLTSLRMVIEIARRSSQGPGITLDDELTTMLQQALGDLQGLADNMQEASRLERGKVRTNPAPCDLATVLAGAREELDGACTLQLDDPASVEGSWDAPRLQDAIAAAARSAARCGDGTNTVRCAVNATPAACTLTLSCGEPGGEPRPVNADLGYPFFRAYITVLALGGSVDVDRAENYCAISLTLPLEAAARQGAG